MSFDPNQNTPPMGHVPPKKKGGALKWILGGLGCFGLLGLLCFGGMGYFGYSAFKQMTNNPAFLEGRATLESSPALGEVLGNPVTVGEFNPEGFRQTQQGERVTIEYDVDLSGPDGAGTATIVVKGQLFTEDWNVESITATVNGEDVPLDGNGIDVNIEGE